MHVYAKNILLAVLVTSMLIITIGTVNSYAFFNFPTQTELSLESQRNTYTIAGTTETAYFNNKASGEYIKNENSIASTSNGLLSVLGTSIKWIISYNIGEDYDYYTIRSASEPSLYLTASRAMSSGRLFLKTIDEIEYETMYQWDIRAVSGGGVIIQSYRNDKCLTFTGHTLVSRDLPANSEDSYSSFVWRQLDVTYYGDTSSYEKRKLTSGYTINTCYLFHGEIAAPKLRDANVGALMIDPFDFSYSGYDTSKFSYNEVKGEFTALTTSFYSTTVTATHKPTGRTATFTLVANPRAVTVGIPDIGHDHESALTNISPDIIDCGYSSIISCFDECESGHIENYLDNNSNNLFVSRSHGGAHVNVSGISIDSYLLLTESSSDNKEYFWASDINFDMSNMKLVMFIACETAKSLQLTGARNLPNAAVYNGAKTALGFTAKIDCSKANEWTIDLIDLLEQGYTIQDACRELDNNKKYTGTTMTTWKIYGDTTTKLN